MVCHMWMQDGCKVYLDSYLALNGSCFMVTWIVFKNHLFEICLTQNRKTMALWTLTTVGLSYVIISKHLHEWRFIEIAFDWGPSHTWVHNTLDDPWPHYMILEVCCWDSLLDTLFWAPTIQTYSFWLVCESGSKAWFHVAVPVRFVIEWKWVTSSKAWVLSPNLWRGTSMWGAGLFRFPTF